MDDFEYKVLTINHGDGLGSPIKVVLELKTNTLSVHTKSNRLALGAYSNICSLDNLEQFIIGILDIATEHKLGDLMFMDIKAFCKDIQRVEEYNLWSNTWGYYDPFKQV